MLSLSLAMKRAPAKEIAFGITAESGNRTLKVGGITPHTLLAYPCKPAAVVFVQGCPWTCSYCNSPHLQRRVPSSPLAWSRVVKLLQGEIENIDAVVFSGGEPTEDPALGDAILDVSELGLHVGLNTSGAYPDQLTAVLPMLDWVALDIKAPFVRYASLTGAADSGAAAYAAAKAVLASGIAHEFRCTVHPSLQDESDLLELSEALAGLGASNLVLQGFRPHGCGNAALKAMPVSGYPSSRLLKKLEQMFESFSYLPA